MINKNLLFPSFLEDPQEYGQAKSFWQKFFNELLNSIELPFHPFYNTQNHKGEDFSDGNPIFDAYLPSSHRLIRIIQFLPEPGDLPITAWIDKVDPSLLEEALQPKPDNPSLQEQVIPELVIHLALSKRTVQLAEQLINYWVVEKLDTEAMEKAIDKLLS